MKILSNITQTIGNTPIVKINNIESNANIYAKLEFFNPGGSIKDRIALNMIEKAEHELKLKPGFTIIEPTSGNTGIGLALVGRSKGYKVILTMPESMSVERRMLLSLYGAELVLTEASKGMKGAIEKATELVNNSTTAFMPSQFTNIANPEIHYNTTGREIWETMDGKIDILVSGVGTGGTLTGCGKFLKEKNPNIKIVAVEPSSSAVLSGENAGPHKIQGIGAGFIPEILDKDLIDEIVKIENDEAIKMVTTLSKNESFFVGISSAAAMCAALKIAEKNENKSKNILVIMPDSGDRYLSILNGETK